MSQMTYLDAFRTHIKFRNELNEMHQKLGKNTATLVWNKEFY